MKRTALFEAQRRLGAKMISFAGWEMPVSYSGILEESLAVRGSAGIFDIGHMGVVDLSGKGALPFLQKTLTNDAAKLKSLRCQYSMICNPSGGVIDDVLVYKHIDGFRLVLNAANTEKDLAWLKEQAKDFKPLKFAHRKDIGMLSLQGPKAQELLSLASRLDLSQLKKNQCELWDKFMVSRTGYTGEDGFELFLPKETALKIWDGLVSRGALPCGLGSRDVLRIEAGLPLYGHEYDENTSPLEAGYEWAVSFDKGEFVGRAALLEEKAQGLKKRLFGLKVLGPAVPRPGYKVLKGGRNIGEVTSGTFSPLLKSPIALAYLSPETAQGEKLDIQVRERILAAEVAGKRFLN